MHTATVSQALTVLTPTLTERLAKVTQASRQLAALSIKVVGQNLDAKNRPVLFIAEPPPRSAGMRIDRRDRTKDGKHHMVSRFGEIDVAWPAESKS